MSMGHPRQGFWLLLVISISVRQWQQKGANAQTLDAHQEETCSEINSSEDFG